MNGIVEQICRLKKESGNTYIGDYDELVEFHVRNNIDHFEYLEKNDRITAYIEWYQAVPVYDKEGTLKSIKKDPNAVYIANIVANSLEEIMMMGRKILRATTAKKLYWSDHRFGGRNTEFEIKDDWRS